MKNEIELKFSAKLENEIVARSVITSFIAQINPSLELISDLKTIVAEAVSNAIIHGYNLDASKEVCLKATIEDELLTLQVSDNGVGIKNIEEAKKPHYTTRPDLERAGMGLTIIETLSDDFVLRSVPGAGSKLVMKIRLSKERIEHGVEQ